MQGRQPGAQGNLPSMLLIGAEYVDGDYSSLVLKPEEYAAYLFLFARQAPQFISIPGIWAAGVHTAAIPGGAAQGRLAVPALLIEGSLALDAAARPPTTTIAVIGSLWNEDSAWFAPVAFNVQQFIKPLINGGSGEFKAILFGATLQNGRWQPRPWMLQPAGVSIPDNVGNVTNFPATPIAVTLNNFPAASAVKVEPLIPGHGDYLSLIDSFSRGNLPDLWCPGSPGVMNSPASVSRSPYPGQQMSAGVSAAGGQADESRLQRIRRGFGRSRRSLGT